MNLILNEAEKELLVNMLKHNINEMLIGVRHSRVRQYKEYLSREEAVAEALLEKMTALQ